MAERGSNSAPSLHRNIDSGIRIVSPGLVKSDICQRPRQAVALDADAPR